MSKLNKASVVVPNANLISVCIPTYKRPGLLSAAIRSCLQQSYRPLEILIGDDSPDDETKELIRHAQMPENVTIRYWHNVPALGQSGNVNGLFQEASGARLILLHDDDFLCRDGLDHLVKAWDRHPGASCVFGKQVVVDDDGVVLAEETSELNRFYARTASKAGPQVSGTTVGLLQQMPNNCYLASTAIVQATRYRSELEVGHITDVDFGIRLGMAVQPSSMIFIDTFVSAYRLTAQSIMRSKNIVQGFHLFYDAVERLEIARADEPARQVLMNRIAGATVLDAASASRRRFALRVFFSKHYGGSYFNIQSAVALGFIFSPALGARTRPLLKAAKQALAQARRRKKHLGIEASSVRTVTLTDVTDEQGSVDERQDILRVQRECEYDKAQACVRSIHRDFAAVNHVEQRSLS